MANDMAKPAKTDATTRQQMRRDTLKAKVLGQSEHNIPVFVMTCAKYAKYAAWAQVNGKCYTESTMDAKAIFAG